MASLIKLALITPIILAITLQYNVPVTGPTPSNAELRTVYQRDDYVIEYVVNGQQFYVVQRPIPMSSATGSPSGGAFWIDQPAEVWYTTGFKVRRLP